MFNKRNCDSGEKKAACGAKNAENLFKTRIAGRAILACGAQVHARRMPLRVIGPVPFGLFIASDNNLRTYFAITLH
jgi:hypothetical protein